MLSCPSAYDNFKGLILCTRSSEKLNTNTAQNDNKENGYFVCGTVERPHGCSTGLKSKKERTIKQLMKKTGSMSKHKKWLNNLRREKERVEKESAERKRQKDEERNRFTEREAIHRSHILELTKKSKICDDSEIIESDECSQDSNSTLINNEKSGSKNKTSQQHESCSSGRNHKSSSKNITRPMWALTEERAVKNEIEKEQSEEDDLLNFVENLDYEKYESDLELISLIDQVKKRIKYLEREQKKDEITLEKIMEKDNNGKDTSKNKSSYNQDWEESNLRQEEDQIDDDIPSVVDTVLLDGGMGMVHSKKSTEALVKKSRCKILERSSNLEVGFEDDCSAEATFDPPISVVHKDGVRLSQKIDLNKLPFKNRNPAV